MQFVAQISICVFTRHKHFIHQNITLQNQVQLVLIRSAMPVNLNTEKSAKRKKL